MAGHYVDCNNPVIPDIHGGGCIRALCWHMDNKIKKRILWAILFSIVFMVFLLLRVEWKQFLLISDRLDIKYLIIACIVYLLANLIRAFRFCKLDHKDKNLVHWWHINAFYNFITSTLPGGVGEAASAFVLKRVANFDLLSALRILLLSRLMDLFALSMLFFVSAILISSDTPYREAAIWFSISLFLISSVALLRSSEQFFLKVMQRIPGKGKLKQKIYEKLSELLKITEEQRSKNGIVIPLFQSVLMMIASIVSIHFALMSFGINFTLTQSFYCYGVYAIFQIVPIQGFAGIGTQAAWWALALNTAGYNAPDVIALGFIIYATYYVLVSLVGFVSWLLWLRDRDAMVWSS